MAKRLRISIVGHAPNTKTKRTSIAVPLSVGHTSAGEVFAFSATAAIFIFLGWALLYMHEQQRQSREQANATQQQSVPAVPLTRPVSDNHGNGSQQQPPHWYSFLGSSVTTDWGLLIVTGLTLSAALQTLRAIQRDVRASTRAARAAERSVAVSESALINGERAYVGCAGWRLDTTAPDIHIRFDLMNSGRTPAWLIESGSMMRINQPTLPPPPPSYVLPFRDEGLLPLFTNISMNRAIRLEGVTAAEIAALNDERRFWFWGFIRYRDAFQKNHITRFLVTVENGRLVVDQQPDYNEAT